ncbi:MAG TPA: hypothetical protein VMF08_02640 [Candidatus Sulfotelmatobacter sp.]|nr:hypothetical protein [Candidatus Sulfotelmatobacter sp.]
MMAEKHHITFFRQTGWMLMASTTSGLMMYLVHLVVTGKLTGRGMPTSEYGVFTALLQVVTMMTIPTAGIQQVIAQQEAGAITEEKKRVVASEFKGVAIAMFFLWLVVAAIIGVFWRQIAVSLQITNPAALLITVLIGLTSLWMPAVQGLLQGRQNFLWLGFMQITSAIGRLGGAFILVAILGFWAAGAMAAVLVGMAGLVAIGLWQARDVWSIGRIPVRWRNWLGRVIPLTLGLGAANFMLSVDMPITQHFFPKEQTGFYAAAGMIGRALVFLTQPLTMVMFPKLARARATGEKSYALELTLCTTIIFVGLAAIAATILPWVPLRIMYPREYLAAAPLIPWFAWCMLPLTLSQVMINSLMARARFSAVPLLVLVAISYGVALWFVGRHCGGQPNTFAGFRSMIQTIGAFNLLMFGICAWFTWGRPTPSPI